MFVMFRLRHIKNLESYKYLQNIFSLFVLHFQSRSKKQNKTNTAIKDSIRACKTVRASNWGDVFFFVQSRDHGSSYQQPGVCTPSCARLLVYFWTLDLWDVQFSLSRYETDLSYLNDFIVNIYKTHLLRHKVDFCSNCGWSSCRTM